MDERKVDERELSPSPELHGDDGSTPLQKGARDIAGASLPERCQRKVPLPHDVFNPDNIAHANYMRSRLLSASCRKPSPTPKSGVWITPLPQLPQFLRRSRSPSPKQTTEFSFFTGMEPRPFSDVRFVAPKRQKDEERAPSPNRRQGERRSRSPSKSGGWIAPSWIAPSPSGHQGGRLSCSPPPPTIKWGGERAPSPDHHRCRPPSESDARRITKVINEYSSRRSQCAQPEIGATNHCITNFSLIVIKQKWTVEKMDSLLKLSTPGTVLKSAVFSDKRLPNVGWQLCLYPGGKREENAENVSLFLKMFSMDAKKEERIKAEYRFHFLDDNDEPKFSNINIGEYHAKPPKWGHSWGLRNIPISKVQNSIRADKSLVIYCEIDVIPDVAKVPCKRLYTDREDSETAKKSRMNDTPTEDKTEEAKETKDTLKVITKEKFPAISLSDDDSDIDLLSDANEAE